MSSAPAHPSYRSKLTGRVVRILPSLTLLAALALHASVPRAGASWGDLEDFHRLGGATTAVAVWQDHAYAAVGSRLWAFALDDAGPRAVGRPLDLPDLPEDMVAYQGRLYVPVRATGGAGMARLITYDLSRPDEPEPIDRPLTLAAREVGAIEVSYPQLYLLTEGGVTILDIKDLDSPRAWLDLIMRAPASARGESLWRGALAAGADHLWIVRDWGLFQVDTMATRPTIVPLDHRPARSVAAGGGRLAIAWTDGTLEVRPASESGRSRTGWSGGLDGPQAMAWTESGTELLVVGDQGRSLRRFDMRDPDRPRLAQNPIALGYGTSLRANLASSGEDAWIALEQGGLLHWDACAGDCLEPGDLESDSQNRDVRERDRRERGSWETASRESDSGERRRGEDGSWEIGSWEFGTREFGTLSRAELWMPPIQDLSLAGERALAAAGDAGLFELALTAEAPPRLLRGLQVVDSGEGKLTLVPAGAIPPRDQALARSLRLLTSLTNGQLAFAQTAEDGLLIFDMGAVSGSGSRDATLIGRLPDLPPAARSTEMLQLDGRLYLAAGDGSLRVIDVRDPRNPRQIASVPNLGAQSLALAGPGRQLLVGGTGTIGTGRISLFDLPAGGEPRLMAHVELDRFHEAMLVSGGFAYLSGSSGFVEIVDLRDSGQPRLLPHLGIRGMPAGRLGQRGELMLAAQTGRLDILRRLDSGALMPVARSNLPTAGDAWAGGTDVRIEAGQALLLRGRAGIFAMTGMAEVAPEQDEPSTGDPTAAQSGIARQFLPMLMRRADAVVSPAESREAKFGATGPPGSTDPAACDAPRLVVLAMDRATLEQPGSASAIADLADALDPQTAILAVGGFDGQAELLAADRPAVLASALREGRQSLQMVADANSTSSAHAPRIDLAFALAERQWEREFEQARGKTAAVAQRAASDSVGADLAPSAAMLAVMQQPPRGHGAVLAQSRADALRAAGWRIGSITLGAAGDASRFGAVFGASSESIAGIELHLDRPDAGLPAALRSMLEGMSFCP